MTSAIGVGADRLKALVDDRLRVKVLDAEPSGIETRVTVLGTSCAAAVRRRSTTCAAARWRTPRCGR